VLYDSGPDEERSEQSEKDSPSVEGKETSPSR